MAVSSRRVDRGSATADGITRNLATEIRTLRLMAGLSQQVVADAVGISHAALSRIERARAPGTPIRTYARIMAVLGARLSCKVYPEGTPLRDQGHLRVMTRFRRLVPPSVPVRTEVLLGIPGDQRAWDLQLRMTDGVLPAELETNLADIQALDRRLAVKMADAGVDRMLLVVADTKHNRRVLREFRSALAPRFPISQRVALAAIREGRMPPGSAILLV